MAAQQVEGSVSRRIAPLKEQLLELIALLEAGIDFAEDDVSVAPAAEILRRLAPIDRRHGAPGRQLRLRQSGARRPDAGHRRAGPTSARAACSTACWSRIARSSPIFPGTTRDLVSEVAAIEGIPVKLVDTAGIRQGEGLVETLGIERSFQAMADADVTLVVVDLSLPAGAAGLALIERARQQGRWLLAGNKCDLPRRAEIAGRSAAGLGPDRRGHRAAARRRSCRREAMEQEGGFITSLRHERLLRESREYLEKARDGRGSRHPA